MPVFPGQGRPCVPVRCTRGFTLAEILVTLLILGVLAGGVYLAAGSSSYLSPSPERVRREGEFASLWIQRVFHKGLVTRRSFVFRLSPSVPQKELKVLWSDGTVEKYHGRDVVWFTNHSGTAPYCTYSPKWHTISPAFTVEVGTSPDRRRPEWYIVVSPFCHVDFRKTPPRD